MIEVVKGFMEDYDGEMVLADVRNFKDEQDFWEKAKTYIEETRGYKVPVHQPTKMVVWYDKDNGEWSEGEKDDSEGQIITVYKSEIEWENAEL